jgi:hypothetical protein
MKKQQVRRKALKKQKKVMITPGRVILELALWDFSGDEVIIRHYANQLAQAILTSYNLDNFGPVSFGLKDEE